MFPSHVMGTFGTNRVMGTFGTNRTMTVDGVIKVVDRMRSGFVPRGFDSLRISNAKFINECQWRSQCQLLFPVWETVEK